jgi:hypothetical protein
MKLLGSNSYTEENVGGKPLTLFEIMIAKTFDLERDFDLSEKYKELMEDLKTVNYETISNSTVLQVASKFIITLSFLRNSNCLSCFSYI